MDIEFWGVRGTFPSPGRNKVRYGGHTPCASIHSKSGELVVIDAGTGIKDLGDRLVGENCAEDLRIILFLTHFHLDHVMGFPFFAPLLREDAEIVVYSPAQPEHAECYLGGLVADRYFPLDLDEMKARKSYKILPLEGLEIGGLKITSLPLHHPQGSCGYRIEDGGRSVVFATDTEHPEKGIDEKLAAFAAGTNHLICDATYTPEEYRNGKRGWGHSTWFEGTRLAAAAGAENLLLSHLNPDHEDDLVDGLAASAREYFKKTTAARQGLRLFL
jgi:phosphoribosyl 1,2-cyclic phosphodiesterase